MHWLDRYAADYYKWQLLCNTKFEMWYCPVGIVEGISQHRRRGAPDTDSARVEAGENSASSPLGTSSVREELSVRRRWLAGR
jgi:hypothetical protein